MITLSRKEYEVLRNAYGNMMINKSRAAFDKVVLEQPASDPIVSFYEGDRLIKKYRLTDDGHIAMAVEL